MIELVKNKMIGEFVIKDINNLSYSKFRYKYLWYLHQNVREVQKEKLAQGFGKQPV